MARSLLVRRSHDPTTHAFACACPCDGCNVFHLPQGSKPSRSALFGSALALDTPHHAARFEAISAAPPSPTARPNRSVPQPSTTRPNRSVLQPSGGSIADIIAAAAQRHGVDPARLIRVATCESHLNPLSVNASSGASGLFQFMSATFYGNGGHNIWDPADQAEIAAKMFAAGQAYQWTCR